MGVASANLTQLSLKAATLCEITRNDSHKTVQGHLRSLIFVLKMHMYAVCSTAVCSNSQTVEWA